jgi:hypothetical protein
MDNENVINVTFDDLDSLNSDMKNWQSMTYDQRKRSDECCIAKYGRTNTELYNLLKGNITSASDKIVNTNESANLNVDEFYTKLKQALSEDDSNGNLRKAEKVAQLSAQQGVVIINPWMVDDEPDYTEEDLDKKYQNFTNLQSDIKRFSNEYSTSIWGYDVYNMYQIMKNKYANIEAEKNFSIPYSDRTLSEYVSDIKKEIESSDALGLKRRLLKEWDKPTGTLFESAVIERLYDQIEEANNGFCDYSSDVPMVTHWFTPEEMRGFGYDVDPYKYISESSTKLHEDISNAIREGDTNKIIELGWNPCVRYNEASRAYARERQIKWFNENKKLQIIDISKYDCLDEAINPIIKLEPIYITLINHGGVVSKVIRGWTHSRWSHAGISLDEKLDHIFSFNFQDPTGKSGFSIENLSFYKKAKDPNLKVITFFVEPKVKEKLAKVIEYYKKNVDKTTYAIKNIFKLVINKGEDTAYNLSIICSQFVDSVLKTVNLDLTGKPSNIVAPGDFEHTNSNPKLFTVYDGSVAKYKPGVVKRKIGNLLSSKLFPDGLLVKPVDEAVSDIFKGFTLESFYAETKNKDVDEILCEIRDLLTPTAIIVEAKPLPVRFGKSGNLFIELPRDLEMEYQESHRLLTAYSENNIEGIKHQLARLFYINSIIEKKISKMDKEDEDYKDLIDLRARVINDFKKYMKIVQNYEKNFDFEQYMKNSEYYNKTVMVDKHTMKYTGALIKDLIKVMK